MNPVAIGFPIPDLTVTQKQLLTWAADFPLAAVLYSGDFINKSYSNYDALVAVGSEALSFKSGYGFAQLQKYYDDKDWLFGYLSYDLKNEVEKLSSSNPDCTGFPEIFFFRPQYVFAIKDNALTIHSRQDDHHKIFEAVSSIKINEEEDFIITAKLNNRTPKKTYLHNVEAIKEDISNGLYYELNYCQQFYSENVITDAVKMYRQFNRISPAPFSSFIKIHHHYIVSSSPERFLQKKGNRLISQPVKGTAKRNLANKEEDEALKHQLATSEKERAENLMIADLVRNDLSRTAQKGTVKAEELCGIYSFRQVHQMITTISSLLSPSFHPVEAIKYAFPMGSMTGAPKVEVMKAIEHYEEVKRGVYSGAIGYIEPGGDFDFSVVIRTILYNSSTHFLSYHAGSAITFDSVAENEYDECLLKAAAVQQLLPGQ